MPFFFWPFLAGFLGIILMISFKVLEMRSENGFVLGKLTSSTNHIAHNSINGFTRFFKAINRKNAMNFLIILLHAVFVGWKKAVGYVKTKLLGFSHSRKLIDAVKGRYELVGKKEESVYFNKIEEKREM